MLSNTSKYAIRALIYLGKNSKDNQKIGIKKISEDLNIPSPFLGKILQVLAKKKLLASTKGPNGGFSIKKNPDEINVLGVIEIFDGLDFFNNCLLGLDCHEKPEEGYQCPIHEKYEPLKEELKTLFENQTIGQFVDDISTTDKLIKI